MDIIFCLGWNYWIDRGLTMIDKRDSCEAFTSRRGIIEQIVLHNYNQTISFHGYCRHIYFEKNILFEPRWHKQRTWQQYKLELIKFLGRNSYKVITLLTRKI